MTLRDPKAKDADGIISWMHDPITKEIFATNFTDFTHERVMQFIENANSDDRNVNFVCANENDEYLGTVSLKNIDKNAENAEYAISFCKIAQGTGAAAFATEEILKYAFETLKLKRVYLNVIADNLRANNFYKKMGFVFEGQFKKHIVINGVLKDLNWYRVLREEYEAGEEN